jgi:hypothetical protein
VRAPVAVPFLTWRPELLETDGRSASATRLARALIYVGTSTRPQISRGRLLGAPAVCLEQELTALNNAPQVADFADRRTRMYAVEEEQLRPIEGAQSCEVPLVQQRLTDGAVGLLSGDPPDSFVEVPVGPEQIGSEMPHDGVFSDCRNELDHGQPVSDDIMIIGAEYGTDFKGRSAAPAPPAREDLPDTIHPEVCVQRELVAQSEQLMLPARSHLTYANPGQIGSCQGRHAEFRSGQHAASQHLVQPLACPPNGVSLRHSLIVTCGLQQLAS